MYKIYIAAAFVLTFASCENGIDETELSTIGVVPCQVKPGYLALSGLNTQTAALSTSEKKLKGLVLVEYDATGKATGRNWQAPSWNKFGWMAAIATDDKGNSFVTPAPVVSLLDNPSELQNTLYKVDTRTGEMSPFLSLPKPDSFQHGNPYGLLGLYFDCHSRLLYASSVAGSGRNKVKGVVYAINPESSAIVDQLEGFDALGLFVGGLTGEKRLFMGSTREAAIYSIELSKTGKFKGAPRLEFSLDMLGPRGDDKARRLRLDKNGDLLVWGVEFNYNLTAASEKQETIYRFKYDKESKTWNQKD